MRTPSLVHSTVLIIWLRVPLFSKSGESYWTGLVESTPHRASPRRTGGTSSPGLTLQRSAWYCPTAVKRMLSFFARSKCQGAPIAGENREAGVNPARSRHCDENCRQRLFVRHRRRSSKPEDLPMALCSLLNASRKGVQAARIPGRLSSPADSLFSPRKQKIGGIFVRQALNTARFQVNRDCGFDPVWFASVSLLGSKANSQAGN